MREKLLKSTEKRLKQNPAFNCYIEEQARVLDSFIIDSFKILKSLLKRVNMFLIYALLV